MPASSKTLPATLPPRWPWPCPRRAGWVPVRTLSAHHRSRIAAHLLALGERGRRLRFGHPASDGQISRYVEQIDFARDEVFGVFNRRLDLVAFGHLACLPADVGASAELGASVAVSARGCGLGTRLLAHAIVRTRNRNIRMLVVHAARANSAMLQIARRAGAELEFDGAEAVAHLPLAEGNLASRIKAQFAERAADLDYRLKRHTRHTRQKPASTPE